MARIDDIVKWAELFVAPDQVTELRALRVNGSETWSGFFSGRDLPALAKAALELEPRAGGIYFVPNPVRVPDSRQLGGVTKLNRGDGTTDDMVTARRWLLVDVDPTRFGLDGKPLEDPGCPSTDAEREAAWQVICRCRGALAAFGLAGEIIGDSGNGWHLCYPVELPNDPASRELAKRVLGALESRSGDPRAHVDLRTFNAARIWKLYGTQARKGTAAGARPWRYSQAVVFAGAKVDPKANTAALIRAVDTWNKQDRLREPAAADPAAYSRKALELEVGKVATAPPGTRNNTLNAAAYSLGQLVAGGELPRDAVEVSLLAAASAVKLSRGEAQQTITSGIEAGMRQPRKAPEPTAATVAKPAAAAPAQPESPKPPPDLGISCADLMSLTLPEPRFAVPGLVPEGVTILAGRPKARKSWFALQVALGVAQGARVLEAIGQHVTHGGIQTAEGDVLYLALEDTRRRLKKRVLKLLAGTGWTAPARLHFRTESDRLPLALGPIEEWLKAHPEARMVIVDTLQKIRPPQKGGQKDGYGDDYAALGDLKKLADRFAVAFLVLHHSRKASADSPFDEISGTLGLTGAADGMFVLQRDHQADTASLYVTGRDIEEETVSLSWDDANCLWSITARESGITRALPEAGQQTRGPSPKRVEAAQWLMRRLINGPMRMSSIITEAENNDPPISRVTLQRAIQDPCFVQYDDESGTKGINGKVYQWVRIAD